MAIKRVLVNGGTAMLMGENVEWDRQIIEVDVPADENRVDRIYVDETGSIDYVAGETTDPLTVPPIPDAPDGTVAVALEWHIASEVSRGGPPPWAGGP